MSGGFNPASRSRAKVDKEREFKPSERLLKLSRPKDKDANKEGDAAGERITKVTRSKSTDKF